MLSDPKGGEPVIQTNVMRRLNWLAFIVGWLSPVQLSAAVPVAHWIAAPVAATNGRTYFRKDIEVSQPVTAARLVAAGRGVGGECFLDGKFLCEFEPYEPLLNLDTSEFSRGTHVLAVRCRQATADACFFLRVQLKLADGRQEVLITDRSWQCSPAEAGGWMTTSFRAEGWREASERAAVDERLLTPDARRIDLSASDNYEQWRQASGAKEGANPALFSVAPGFRIERVRSAAPGEDSWISLTFDPQGRAIISQEQQGLLRMTLAKDGSAIERVERINDDLKEVRGLVFLGGDLYANANNSKGLYRLRGDAKGNLDKPELLVATEGGVGHGRNDLTVGPDGKIYSIHGDDVLPLASARDWTRGPGEPRPANSPGEGHLVRFDPAAGKLEILTTGLRNPFGIAFNPDGQMFTYDADAEFDMGAPWYRPTRVDHLTLGGDFGWRAVTGRWPPYYADQPDDCPPSLDIGRGSPTAVMFGTPSNFPRRYREALFMLDWAYGRILVVHCLPHGASYLCEAESFVKGRPLNVTDLDFAPDGSMYIVTGGRKTQSALYRIRYTGDQADESTATDAPPPDPSAALARKRRREIEALLEQPTLKTDKLEQVWRSLDDIDPRIRYAARTVIQRQPFELWEQRALGETEPLAALTALSVLARRNDPARQARVLRRLNDIDLTDAPLTQRHLAAWIYFHCAANLAKLEPKLADAVRSRLEKLYPDRNFLVNMQLSQALAELGSSEFVDKTLRLLGATTEQREQLHYLFVLRNITVGWTPAARQTYFDALAEARQYLGGEGMPGFLDRIRKEALAAVPDAAERRRFEALLARDPSADDEPLPPRPFVKKWTVSESLDAIGALSDHADLKRGRALFIAASCSKCHRVGRLGASVGPDLTTASSRFSRKDLLESIIEPSKSIAENYRSLMIVTKDGKVYVGRPVQGGDYRSQTLRLAVDPQHPFQVTEIDKRKIEQEQVSAISFMPEGLLDTLSTEEIRDLVAFIESGGRQ